MNKYNIGDVVEYDHEGTIKKGRIYSLRTRLLTNWKDNQAITRIDEEAPVAYRVIGTLITITENLIIKKINYEHNKRQIQDCSNRGDTQ